MVGSLSLRTRARKRTFSALELSPFAAALGRAENQRFTGGKAKTAVHRESGLALKSQLRTPQKKFEKNERFSYSSHLRPVS